MRTLLLLVPAPALPGRLDRFLAANVHGLSRKQVKRLIDAGQVQIDGRKERKAAARLRPGCEVRLDFRPSLLAKTSLERSAVLQTTDDWLAVNKPPGLPTHRTDDGAVGVPELLGEVLGSPADSLQPVHRLDRDTSGVLLVARNKRATSALSGLFATRAVEKRYRAVVRPAPRQDAGRIEGPDGMLSSWTLLRRSADGSRAELAVQPEQGRTHQIRIQLAHAGTPIVGDLEHGAPVPGGAPRMALHCERLSWAGHVLSQPPPSGWDSLLDPPDEPSPAQPGPERRSAPPGSGRRTLKVSPATARILRGGHPWVVRDGKTGDLGPFMPGDLADLVDSRGDFVATAIVDPRQPVCARVVSQRPGSTLDDEAWARRAGRALERRRGLLDSADTNALRLIHAEADGLPGLQVDLWGSVLVATRTSAAAERFTARVYDQLRDALGPLPIYERDHFEDLRSRRPAPRDAELPGRWLGDPSTVRRWTVLEGGLRFEVEPLGGLTTGLYPDQRENRALLRELLAEDPRPGVVANLFAHTGAFSVACVAGGADKVITVDLSPRYCEWTRRNLVLNHMDPTAHPVVAADSLTWLREAPELAGVILDPPSYARGRSKGVDWNARRDYRALVTEVAGTLRPGGWLLCCVNSKGLKRGWLAQEVEAGLRAAGRRLRESRAAPPASDHPRLKGFPEGLSFNGLLAWTEE